MNIHSAMNSNLHLMKPFVPSLHIPTVSSEVGIHPENILKLDIGENFFVDSLYNDFFNNHLSLHSYPDASQIDLRNKLAQYTGYTADHIAVGNGSDELISLLLPIFSQPKDEIIINPPTYYAYQHVALLNSVSIKTITRNKDLTVNLQSIKESINQKTKIIFIDSPANPCGTIISRKALLELLHNNVIVVVDEAYMEYVGTSYISLVKDYPNLVMLRTLSKWAGLAGMRIGYMVAHPSIIELVMSIKMPHNIGSISYALACYALDNASLFLDRLKQVKRIKNYFIKHLRQFPDIEIKPSNSMYVVFTLHKTSAMNLQKFLFSQGILVKVINEDPLLNTVRITIPAKVHVNKLISLLTIYFQNYV